MGKFSLSQLTDSLTMLETIYDCYTRACSHFYGQTLDEELSKTILRDTIVELQQHENIQQWLTRIG